MVGYRCYILDAEDHILQAHDLDCQDDDQAVSAAQSLLTQDPYHHGAEIWRATRRIRKLQRTTAVALSNRKKSALAQWPSRGDWRQERR